MQPNIIRWNGLYSRQPAKRAFARTRIIAHYGRFGLERRGVSVAVLRYVFILSNAALSLTSTILFCRPTGWHGESGAAHSGGHITIDFLSSDDKHIATHHVYPSDDAYQKATRCARRRCLRKRLDGEAE